MKNLLLPTDPKKIENKSENILKICYNCNKELLEDFYLIVEDPNGNQFLGDDLYTRPDNWKEIQTDVCGHCGVAQ